MTRPLGRTEVVIAAAADGAGSARRSLNGAIQACHTFFECAQLAVSHLSDAVDFLDDGFATRTVEDIRSRMAELAAESDEPLSAYACTLLGAIVADHAAVFVQLGDGAIVYRMQAAGQAMPTAWSLALSPQRGEFANETVFVTRSDAPRRIAIAPVIGQIAEFALMTDGIEQIAIRLATGEPHAPFFERVFEGLRAASEVGEVPAHREWLDGFLASPAVCARTDDDKTLVLCTRYPPG